MLQSWHIRSRARHCAITEAPFEEGETIVTALFPDPDSSGYLRRDYSLAAWEGRDDDAEPAFSFWRSKYEAPVVDDEPDPMEKEDPETLLRRLVDEDAEHTENVRYILAVMLERKKLLRETDAQPIPTGILRVYEHRKTGEAYLIRDPNIPLEEIEKVQEDVLEMLEHGGRRPEPESETEQAPAESDGESPESPDPDQSETAESPAEEGPPEQGPRDSSRAPEPGNHGTA